MKFTPLGDRVLAQRIKEEDKIGSFYVPEQAKEKPQQGVVVSSGTNCEFGFVSGMSILFGKYSGNEIKIDGESYLILREEEILGILEK